MGCCCYKRVEIESSLEDSIFFKLENQIGLKHKDSYYIDRVVHRHSYNNTMSQTQFKKAISELAIDSEKPLDFFEKLKEDGKYQTKRINCLGILLGRGGISLKVKLLFQNYDLDTSGTLCRPEIEAMISDIVTLTCKIIPEYALSQNLENAKLNDYVLKLDWFSGILIKHFVSMVLENRGEINLDEFQQLFTDRVIMNLLRTKQLREYAFRLYYEIAQPAKAVMDSMSEIEDQDSPISKIISRFERSRTCDARSSSSSFAISG